MLKDVTLGQFFPGSTPIHKLDPRTKLVLVIVYIVALFLAKWFVSYVVVAAFLAMVIAMSRIRLKVVLKNLKPLLFIILLTAVLNLFYGQGEPIAQFWIFKITKSGLENAIFMVLRISLLVAGTFMLTYTTSPISLTDGLESLLSPLKKLHAPVHELSMMMSIALRFIPTLIEETDKIMSAQKARGADFESGNLLSRAKAMVPILVPLFISAFRRADELATAMECRCYHGGEGRTKLSELHYQTRDWVAYLTGAALLAVMIVLRHLPGLSIYGVSIGGAAAHNLGQMAAACITLGNTMVLGYLPFLLAVSLVTGTLTGFVASLLFRAMRNIHLSH